MDNSIEVSARSPARSTGDKIIWTAIIIFLVFLVSVFAYIAVAGRTPWEAYQLSVAREAVSEAVDACSMDKFTFDQAKLKADAAISALNGDDGTMEDAAFENRLALAGCGPF
jgi:hypothetical protein